MQVIAFHPDGSVDLTHEGRTFHAPLADFAPTVAGSAMCVASPQLVATDAGPAYTCRVYLPALGSPHTRLLIAHVLVARGIAPSLPAAQAALADAVAPFVR
jgi:hypothetical protein